MHIGDFPACRQGKMPLERNANGQTFPDQFRPVEKTLTPAVFGAAILKAG
jgi:hypothetical protein